MARFFKTSKGEYGEGDIFYGINTPTSKKIAKEFCDLDLDELTKLFQSPVHEERSIGISILGLQYADAIKANDEKSLKRLYKKFYSWKKSVNNWDLVDSSAPYISGHYYFHFEDRDLFKLVKSKDLWDRRIAVVSCFYHIRQSAFDVPLKVIEARLYDKEDLMHKACGWMLREIGKRDVDLMRRFLKDHAHSMPRTALRYSIEKLSPIERKKWMDMKNK